MSISLAQRTALHNQIWKIADDVRGAVEGWDFKQYILGALFYRFISEDFANYVNDGQENSNYELMKNDDVSEELKKDALLAKGYFIAPEHLFCNLIKNAHKDNDNLNIDLPKIFTAIENSANGTEHQNTIKGLFADFDTTSSRLGSSSKDKNRRLLQILEGIKQLSFGDFGDNEIDVFGDAYEFLISNYATNAGKSGGEFFTPQCVSKLIAQLATHDISEIKKVYDPACGSGSLLLQVKKHFTADIEDNFEGFFGQEINHTNYNLARMNMFLHNIQYEKINIALGDTLFNPQFLEYIDRGKNFDVIVSNPPYSIKWDCSNDGTRINDPRFSKAGVLAPKSKADLAFVLHALHYLSGKGRAAIVCFPGIFYRGGAEQKIRQYLVDSGSVECLISLAPNLFYGVSIAVTILVLSTGREDSSKVQFIDASKLFTKSTNNNFLSDEDIAKIMEVFVSKEDILHFSKMVDKDEIARNDYNLSVSSYVEAEDLREKVNIVNLNNDIEQIVNKINELRQKIIYVVHAFRDFKLD